MQPHTNGLQANGYVNAAFNGGRQQVNWCELILLAIWVLFDQVTDDEPVLFLILCPAWKLYSALFIGLLLEPEKVRTARLLNPLETTFWVKCLKQRPLYPRPFQLLMWYNMQVLFLLWLSSRATPHPHNSKKRIFFYETEKVRTRKKLNVGFIIRRKTRSVEMLSRGH